MLDYISVQQAVDKWKISERRIQKLCEENRIEGANSLRSCLGDTERFGKAC